MIVGMGAAAFVVESAEAARERGHPPICEVLGAVTANSAFHGTRLDVDHISQRDGAAVVAPGGGARRRPPRDRRRRRSSSRTRPTPRPAAAAPRPRSTRCARRSAPAADQIVIANTKGFTGHAMGAGIEDVVAVKALETGVVPPVPNFKEPDPELGELNLSQGGAYPVQLRAAPGRRLRLADRDVAAAVDADARRPAPRARRARLRLPDRRLGGWQRWLDARSTRPGGGRRSRWCSAGCASSTRREPTREPRGASREQRPSDAHRRLRRPRSRPRPPVAVAVPAPVQPAAARGRGRRRQRPTRTRSLSAVVAIVAEKTGYPPEMLDLDLDLEADLGVDTVKQAEIFAAVREAFGIERDETLQLRDFPTLEPRDRLGAGDRAGAPAGPAASRDGRPVAPAAAGRGGAPAAAAEPCRLTRSIASGWWRSWPRRPATRLTCWTWIWTSRPTWASTRSSRPSCSRRCARRSASQRDDDLQAARLPDAATT